jgi:hypothetical protein
MPKVIGNEGVRFAVVADDFIQQARERKKLRKKEKRRNRRKK